MTVAATAAEPLAFVAAGRMHSCHAAGWERGLTGNRMSGAAPNNHQIRPPCGWVEEVGEPAAAAAAGQIAEYSAAQTGFQTPLVGQTQSVGAAGSPSVARRRPVAAVGTRFAGTASPAVAAVIALAGTDWSGPSAAGSARLNQRSR